MFEPGEQERSGALFKNFGVFSVYVRRERRDRMRSGTVKLSVALALTGHRGKPLCPCLVCLTFRHMKPSPQSDA